MLSQNLGSHQHPRCVNGPAAQWRCVYALLLSWCVLLFKTTPMRAKPAWLDSNSFRKLLAGRGGALLHFSSWKQPPATRPGAPPAPATPAAPARGGFAGHLPPDRTKGGEILTLASCRSACSTGGPRRALVAA